MNVAKDWQDYEILDMANGEKLERWKNVILVCNIILHWLLWILLITKKSIILHSIYLKFLNAL